MLGRPLDRVIICNIEHAEAFMGKIPEAVFINEFLDFLGRVKGEREGVTPHFKLDVFIKKRIDPCELLMRSLDSLDIFVVCNQLKLVKKK